MSYNTYSIDGFGICDADNPCQTTKDRVEALLALAPETARTFHDCIESDDDYKDLDWYESEFENYGALGLLCDVMNEAEHENDITNGISFIMCEDCYENCRYLMYKESYPWCMSDREKMLTASDLGEIFRKYSKILFGAPATVGFYVCRIEVNYG